MALKTIKKCQECSRRCKQQVDEVVWEGARLMSCPSSSKGFEKRKK